MLASIHPFGKYASGILVAPMSGVAWGDWILFQLRFLDFVRLEGRGGEGLRQPSPRIVRSLLSYFEVFELRLRWTARYEENTRDVHGSEIFLTVRVRFEIPAFKPVRTWSKQVRTVE